MPLRKRGASMSADLSWMFWGVCAVASMSTHGIDEIRGFPSECVLAQRSEGLWIERLLIVYPINRRRPVSPLNALNAELRGCKAWRRLRTRWPEDWLRRTSLRMPRFIPHPECWGMTHETGRRTDLAGPLFCRACEDEVLGLES